MRILKATDIPMSKRRPHLARYRAQLRDALMNPGLSEDQKAKLRTKLNSLGQIKPYAALAAQRSARHEAFVEEHKVSRDSLEPDEDTEDSPGAVTTTMVAEEASPTVGADLDSLLDLTKAELIALAESEGAEAHTSWTKAKIAQSILDRRNGA